MPLVLTFTFIFMPLVLTFTFIYMPQVLSFTVIYTCMPSVSSKRDKSYCQYFVVLCQIYPLYFTSPYIDTNRGLICKRKPGVSLCQFHRHCHYWPIYLLIGAYCTGKCAVIYFFGPWGFENLRRLKEIEMSKL